MDYQPIRIDLIVVVMYTIILSRGKYSYERLPIGMSSSTDTFQTEMIDLMEALEYQQGTLMTYGSSLEES
jgi:DNA repair photolyase